MIDKFDGQYAFLSNFYPSTIEPFDDGIRYPTVEHAFQAAKTTNIAIRKNIASQPTPGKAKYIGRHIKLRPEWREARIDVMRCCLRKKFEKPELQKKLLATGDEILREGNCWHDNYWGDCYCDKCHSIIGLNNLGKLLMEIREEIK